MGYQGKVLGVDYGDVRTGLAVSDPTGMLASGIMTIKENGMRNTAKRVAAEAAARDAVAIVVGLPKNMNGTEGPRAEVVRAFAELLREETPLEIIFCDERMSTIEAYRFLSATETFGKKRRDVVDTLSAEIILQSWLDREKNKSER